MSIGRVDPRLVPVASMAVAKSASRPPIALGPRKDVKCICGHHLFDGIVVRSRIVRILPRGGAEALCRCKRWLPVPVSYDEKHLPENMR